MVRHFFAFGQDPRWPARALPCQRNDRGPRFARHGDRAMVTNWPPAWRPITDAVVWRPKLEENVLQTTSLPRGIFAEIRRTSHGRGARDDQDLSKALTSFLQKGSNSIGRVRRPTSRAQVEFGKPARETTRVGLLLLLKVYTQKHRSDDSSVKAVLFRMTAFFRIGHPETLHL